MKPKAAMELDILCCGYSRQLVHSIFFTIGIPTLVTWAGSLLLSFCLIFSNFPRQRKMTLVSWSPCCNLRWKYRLDFAFHGIFTSETSIGNVMNVSLYMYVLISRTRKCHFPTKPITRFCSVISFDEERMINVFIKTVLPWFFNISNVYFSPTFTANYFLVNQKQKW